jgi:ABC-type sugar transport system ATPase subunit
LDPGEYTLGVRPQHLHPAPNQETGLAFKVELVSDLGAERYMHGLLGGRQVSVRAEPGSSISRGREISLSVDPQGLHLFKDGRRVD